MTHRFTMAALAASLAGPVLAQDAPPPPAPPAPVAAPAPVAPPKPKIICRREVEIGSLVKGVRRCGTPAEWRASERAAREATDRIQSDKGRYCAPGQPTC